MRPIKPFVVTISLVLVAVGCGLDRTALQANPDAGSGKAGSSGNPDAGGATGQAGSGSGTAGSGSGTAGSGSGTAGTGTGVAGNSAGGGGGASYVCPGLGCAPKCENGVKVDAHGCATCECNPSTCPDLVCTAPWSGAAPGPGAGGVGVPAVICPYGSKTDANGCATCECLPKPVCGPVCAIYCQYGNVTDANGCPTCKCNPPPPGACSAAECGPGPAIATRLCPDGKTTAGPICLRDQTGVCGWHITECPMPKTCDRNQCPQPAPGAPNYLCPDGKTVAGPACVVAVGVNGAACGWTFVSCPPTCVDNVACIVGFQWDSVLCKCVPSPPPPDKCACAAGQMCVQQIGGPAVQTNLVAPPSPCESPDPTCLQTGQDACACLAARDGKCKADPASARSCVCDNGIR
jgi:hypothetical protein